MSGKLAFWISGNPASAAPGASPMVGPINCLQTVPSEDYALRGIPEGKWRIHAAIWEAMKDDPTKEPRTPDDLLESGPFRASGSATTSTTVRPFEDFVASYEWKHVEEWHRMPSGLEIVLDLGGGNERKARIPQPWSWDVRVEDGEASTRRVSVKADTTMAEVLTALDLSTTTHEVVWRQDDGAHERSLQASWTAQQADLFRYSKQIVIRRHATMID
eukprot:TRINITY_DN68376_c0_g1_i1.p1 TRINITY_DN68376_c0_g1~~TRINITY_DN68376_c0_g1_i1.p1  ORF type:complete len:217 (-),score=34.95 TRINITY_DN68376_c0_g1_i1:54-704(-)